MAADAILGIDVGTTSVKAEIIRPGGEIVASFAQDYPTARAGTRVEQDPEDWTRLIGMAFDRFAGHEVAAIGLCSQVNTHVFTGADGRALRPAILWQDGRAAAEAAALDARVSDAQKIEWWGAPMPIDASHALSRMAWVANHEPEIWTQTRHVLLPKDYCLHWLTGALATDPLSSIGLVGPDMAYIPGVFDLVPGSRDRVAPLFDVTEVIGHAARGPFNGVPVVAGTMDAWAGLIGTGGAEEGRAVYLSGTSEIAGITSRTVNPTPGVIVFPECSGLRVHAGPTNSGGEALAWFAETMGLALPEISAMVAAHPRSAATPLFLPQLQGERAPLWDADLRAAFLGVSRGTGRADFARAVLEGVAFSVRHIMEALAASSAVTPDWIAGGGGGFRSDIWSQIRADVLGAPIRRLASEQPGALGAAMIAGVGAGLYPSLAAASADLVRHGRTFEPEARMVATYDSVFGVYKEAIAAQRELTLRLQEAAQN